MKDNQQIKLEISEEVERTMEKRHILQEDVLKVIEHAEATGEKFINLATGRSLASFRPTRVTFWVEYSSDGDVYHIYSAYSHRMERKRGAGS